MTEVTVCLFPFLVWMFKVLLDLCIFCHNILSQGASLVKKWPISSWGKLTVKWNRNALTWRRWRGNHWCPQKWRVPQRLAWEWKTPREAFHRKSKANETELNIQGIMSGLLISTVYCHLCCFCTLFTKESIQNRHKCTQKISVDHNLHSTIAILCIVCEGCSTLLQSDIVY